MTRHSELLTAYLPLQPGRRFVPIRGLSPDQIKIAAKVSRTDQHSDGNLSIGHNKAINQIIKALGFSGGIDTFRNEYETRLTQFMEHHGLVQRSGILFEKVGENFFSLTQSQIAGRLFASGLPMPHRIFVGADIEVWDFLQAARSLPDVKIGCGHQGHIGRLGPSQPFEQMEPASINPQFPPFSYFIRTPEVTLEGIEIGQLVNLIGGQLIDFGPDGVDEAPVATIYKQGRPLTTAEERDHTAKGDLIRRIVRQIDAGWVEVLPYNDRLAFLKGSNGLYDFVFANQREMPFVRRPYASAMPQDHEVERTANDKLEEWLYFSYEGWEERDLHRAEVDFYRSGGHLTHYEHGAILRNYLTNAGIYMDTPQPSSATLRIVNGIPSAPARMPTRLIESREFHYFLSKNPEYAEHRLKVGNPLSNADVQADCHLPAAVTWFDAIAYVDWARKTSGKNVRLLTETEYLEAAADLIPEEISEEDVRNAREDRLCSFVGPDGTVLEENPPRMPQADFAKWRLEFKPGVEDRFVTSMHGMRVLRSFWFGEWLEPRRAAINSLFFCAQSMVMSASRFRVSANTDRFAPHSTGKYKGMKIGFRIVYLD